MQLRELLRNEEDRAVSPVIGVILMVAITVILAAVIGTFVLGLGDQVQTTAPNANFNFDYDSSGNQNLTVTHTGGDGVSGDEVFLRGDVNRTGGNASWQFAAGLDEPRAGDSVRVGADTASAYSWASGVGNAPSDSPEVRVTWEDSDSDQSSTLRTWTAN